MPPLRDTLSRRSKTSCNRSYSPLLCRSRKSVSLSWRDGPLSANSIFTPTPPMQKQYGFLTVCKNREMRSFRESALSKVIPLTSGRDSAATAPMSTLLICSSSCVVNFTVNLLSVGVPAIREAPVQSRGTENLGPMWPEAYRSASLPDGAFFSGSVWTFSPCSRMVCKIEGFF